MSMTYGFKSRHPHQIPESCKARLPGFFLTLARASCVTDDTGRTGWRTAETPFEKKNADENALFVLEKRLRGRAFYLMCSDPHGIIKG